MFTSRLKASQFLIMSVEKYKSIMILKFSSAKMTWLQLDKFSFFIFSSIQFKSYHEDHQKPQNVYTITIFLHISQKNIYLLTLSVINKIKKKKQFRFIPLVIQYSIKTYESDIINVVAWKADQYAICIIRRMYQNSTK